MKKTIIKQLLSGKSLHPEKTCGTAFASSNIALCKYWGKRDLELNLPVTDSLSVSLAHKGATATIQLNHAQHEFIINNKSLDAHTTHYHTLASFLNLFVFNKFSQNYYRVQLNINVPLAAGLASSACIFAAIVKALDNLYQWELDTRTLSILARLGSGSACRSIESGFLQWYRGESPDGMDSYAVKLPYSWPELCVGLCLVNTAPKSLSSRDAMQCTITTSPFYSTWPKKCEQDIAQLHMALMNKDFDLLGKTAESNAIAMHAAALTAWPPILYSQPETIAFMHRVWACRREDLPIYFTQDAGPNLKLLFLSQDEQKILTVFPEIQIIRPFEKIDVLV